MARKAPVAIHARAITALMHISKSSAIGEAPSQIPISDVLSGVAWCNPVGATLCRHATTGPRFEVIARAHPGRAFRAAISQIARNWSPACRALPKFALTRPVDSGAAALPKVGLIEALLRLANSRPGGQAVSRATVAVGHIAVGIRHASAMSWIVNPGIAVCDIHAIEVVASDEVVVDHHIVVTPSAAPPLPPGRTALHPTLHDLNHMITYLLSPTF